MYTGRSRPRSAQIYARCPQHRRLQCSDNQCFTPPGLLIVVKAVAQVRESNGNSVQQAFSYALA